MIVDIRTIAEYYGKHVRILQMDGSRFDDLTGTLCEPFQDIKFPNRPSLAGLRIDASCLYTVDYINLVYGDEFEVEA